MAGNVFDLTDRVMVVTGGLGQLGRRFSLALLESRAKVAVFDVAEDQREVESGLREWIRKDRLVLVSVDVTRKESIEAGVDRVVEQWEAPHGLVNCAALDSPPAAPAEQNGPFENYPEAAWEQVMAVNAKGVFLCCQAIGGRMAAAGRGSIINICSIYGMVAPDQRIYEYRREAGEAFFKPVAYGASKAAILNLTRYLATYWARSGVRVNTLTLGGVFNGQDQKFLEGYCSRVPLGRMAREDEYNGAVAFLLSDASSYMTGSNLIMDGGWTAW